MGYIIYGAGGIGGSIGARLHLAGYQVCLIARGAHFEAIRTRGLEFHSPSLHERLKIDVVSHPKDIEYGPNDVVLLCMKAQHTEGALRDLQLSAPSHIPVICCQNGVANERMALRRFQNVYGMVVWVPTEHLEPGVVINFAENKAGNLDAGRYPTGKDELIEEVTAGIEFAGFSSQADDAIMTHKYAKLLANLANVLDAATSDSMRDISSMLREEARECLSKAGIPCADMNETRERRSAIRGGAVEGFNRHGSSTYQSLLRDTGNLEADYLNGEITQLGRLHGVATPANVALQRIATQLVNREIEPRSLSGEQIRDLISQETH